jgi:hypothetical protein
MNKEPQVNHPAGDGDAAWRISSRSGGGDCVEVGRVDGSIAVRHSRHPDGGMIVYTVSEWQAFLAGVKGGEFDDLAEVR